MLNARELLDLEKTLHSIISERLGQILSLLNRTEQLPEFLVLIDCENFIESGIPSFSPVTTGKIVVLGESEIKIDKLLGIAKELSIDKSRFEFHLKYDGLGDVCKKLQGEYKCSLIMVGPLPHSMEGKRVHSSVITAMEQSSDYPPVLRLGTNCLKITKSGFRTKLKEAIDKQYITT